jgi:hypothetical protein
MTNQLNQQNNLDIVTTIQVFKSVVAKLDKYQKSKKLRTRGDAIEALLKLIKLMEDN